MKNASWFLTLLVVTLLLCDTFTARSNKRSKKAKRQQIDDDEDALTSLTNVDVTLLGGYNSRYGQFLREKEALWKKAVISVYNLTIFPYNEHYIRQFQLKGANDLSWLPNVINASACARVHAFGDHCGPLSIAEYYFGLTPNTLLFETTPSRYIRAFDLVKFFVNVETKTAFSTINYRIGALTADASTWANATQVGTFRFDDNDKMVETELWNPLYSLGVRDSKVREALDYKFQLSNYTCFRHGKYCQNTPYKQYADYSACMKFLMNAPLGEPDTFTSNSVLCRHQHSTLIQLRPEIHCAHLGPSGGGFCLDRPVSYFFNTPLFPDENRLISPTKKLN